MEKILDKKECTGCSACYNICPKNAIEMREDEEGFKYPSIIKEKCINCGLCKTICPVIKEKSGNTDLKSENVQACIAAYDKEEKNRSASSSGGVFAKIAEYVLAKNGIIFGAGYNETLEVIQKEAKNREELEELKRF